MIDMTTITLMLPQMTGDSVKVAVYLASLGVESLRADAGWYLKNARAMGLHAQVVRACVRELVELGLVARVGRVDLTAVGAPVYSSGREGEGEGKGGRGVEESVGESGSLESPAISSETLDSDDTPPWETHREAAPRSVDLYGPTAGYRAAPVQAELPEVGPQLAPVTTAVATFDSLYREANAGSKPTWDGKAIALLKQLVDKHGEPEVIRRIRIMFLEPPAWPPPPYDITSLRFHFDKFARPGKPRGGVARDPAGSGADYYGSEVHR